MNHPNDLYTKRHRAGKPGIKKENQNHIFFPDPGEMNNFARYSHIGY